MSNKIILGLQFGDEGKGLFTDYLCSQFPDSLDVRFSGGHQVSHTVVTDEVNHMFTNFGSGTLRGIPSYWSKYCTVEPIGLINELEILESKSIIPLLYIDEQCPITTPFDIDHNKRTERVNCHGSCGVGFNSTINRKEKYYSLTFLDLFYPNILRTRLRAIEHFYNNTLDLTTFFECCETIVNYSFIRKVYGLPKYNNHIFEGSQGLLLDQNFGFFPNVTRANTGMKNAVELVGSEDFDIYLITRAYQTRHGNGFMTNEGIPNNILSNLLESNKENEYQGKFRKSLLDLSLLEYAINKDEFIRKSERKNLVITCLDHIINEYRFTYKNKIIYCSNEDEFIVKISDILRIKDIYISKSNNSKNIIKFRR